MFTTLDFKISQLECCKENIFLDIIVFLHKLSFLKLLLKSKQPIAR